MNDAAELFPRTAEDDMNAVRAMLVTMVEKREEAVERAEVKLQDAQILLAKFDGARTSEKAAMARFMDPTTGEVKRSIARQELDRQLEQLQKDGVDVSVSLAPHVEPDEAAPTTDTLTMVEVAQEFGALIAIDEKDGLSEDQSRRYNALADELNRRDRNPSDWQHILREAGDAMAGVPTTDVVDAETAEEVEPDEDEDGPEPCMGEDCAYFDPADGEDAEEGEGECHRDAEPRQVKAGESPCATTATA